jgi:hypothetical protein
MATGPPQRIKVESLICVSPLFSAKLIRPL